MPTDEHPLAAEMMGALPVERGPATSAAAAGASGLQEDVCAACRFAITGEEPAVRAPRGMYHAECFSCAACGAALLPSARVVAAEAEAEAVSGADDDDATTTDAVARELRRVRLGSLDGADGEGGNDGDVVEEEGNGGGGLTFLELDGLPLCRRHFRERLRAMQQEQAAPAAQPIMPTGDADDGAETFATAPSSPTVRFAPFTEPAGGSSGAAGLFPLPTVFHSADGLERLRIPPPTATDGVGDGPGSPRSAEGSPSSRLQRSQSAAALRSGRGQPPPRHHQRRGSHAHPLLSVAARETAAERDARLLRQRVSQQALLLGGAPGGGLSPPSSSAMGQRSLLPRSRRPLTTATALAYGVQVARGEGGDTGAVEKAEEGEGELGEGAFTERRQRELVYDVGGAEGDAEEEGKGAGSSSKPMSIFFEEAAPRVFARVRRLFGVAPAVYVAALAALEEEEEVRCSVVDVMQTKCPSFISSPPNKTHCLTYIHPIRQGGEKGTGKSGSRFLRPPRGESGALVVVKTVSAAEEEFLMNSILEDYYQVRV